MQAFDFDNALTMRRAWKMKFHLALGSVQGKDYDTGFIGDAANRNRGLAGFATARELLPVHDEFHRQSRAIADEIRSGSILVMTDPAIVAFLDLSAQIGDLLRKLKTELQAGT